MRKLNSKTRSLKGVFRQKYAKSHNEFSASASQNTIAKQEQSEAQLQFSDGQTWAESVPLELEEPKDNSKFSTACSAWCLDDQMHGEIPVESRKWMVSQGNSILQKLYGLENLDFNNIEKLLKDLGMKDLVKNSGIMELQLYEKICHRSPITKWFSPKILWKVANQNRKNESAKEQMRKEFLLGIVCVMWALYNQSAKQGDFFERGSFKIIDAQDKLFHLLKKYVQYASGQDNPTYANGSDFAYSRDPKRKKSSHYKDPEFKSEQYGVDMRLWHNFPNVKILPHQMAHLLCGQIEVNEKKFTFVKFESIGLGNMLEFMEHGMNFLHPRKKAAIYRREKDIPQNLQDIYTQFQKKYYKLTGEKLHAKNVNAMYKQIFEARKLGNSFNNLFLDFSKVNHVEIRTGNEVILDFATSFLSTQELDTIEKEYSNYVNQFHPNATIFEKNVQETKAIHPNKFDTTTSLADDLENISLADFIKKAHSASRDQLVIDVIHEYANENTNADPSIKKFIDSFAALNVLRTLQVTYDTKLRELRNLKDPQAEQLTQPLLQSYSEYKYKLLQALMETQEPSLVNLVATVDRFAPKLEIRENADQNVGLSNNGEMRKSKSAFAPLHKTTQQEETGQSRVKRQFRVPEVEITNLLNAFGSNQGKIEQNLKKLYQDTKKGVKGRLKSFYTRFGHTSANSDYQIKGLAILIADLQKEPRFELREKGIIMQAYLLIWREESKKLGSPWQKILQNLEQKIHAITNISLNRDEAINIINAHQSFKSSGEMQQFNQLLDQMIPNPPNFKPHNKKPS